MTKIPSFAAAFAASRRAAILTGLAATLVLGGFGLRGGSNPCTGQTVVPHDPVTLTYWRVFDDGDAFDTQFNAFRALHPNVSINYRKLLYDEYQTELLKAMSEGRAPDVVSLHVSWLNRYQNQGLLKSAPPVISTPRRTLQGTIKKEMVWDLQNEPGPTPQSVANDFVDTVQGDVVILTEQADPRLQPSPQVYALPLAVDTMVLYYNKDILNRAGIATPASDWRSFQEQVKRITKLDETGAIIQSAAALGTGANVERSADILAALMMQNGAPMTSANGTVTFDKFPPEMAGRPNPPGADALVFYTDFANPEKEVYTWNDKMPGSLQAFANGQTAFFFGYAYHLPQIRQLGRGLNFGIAPFPQIEGNKPVYYANYWVEAVTASSQHSMEAWSLVKFLTAKENAPRYLSISKKPTALRALVNSQLEDLDLSVFAAQVPSSKSWYHGIDADATEQAFVEMIRQMLAGEADPARIVELAATKVNQTIK